MSQPSPDNLDEVREQLVEHATKIGEHIVAHARLLTARDALTAGRSEPGPQRHDGDEPEDNAQLEADRVSHVDTMQRSFYRLLYVLDFSLVHGRLDRPLLRDARRAVIDGIDAADAYALLIDGTPDSCEIDDEDGG